MLTARLHPIKPKKGGEVYSVIFRGKLLVERSKEPTFDLARALLVKGITGKAHVARRQDRQAPHRDRHRAVGAALREGRTPTLCSLREASRSLTGG
jgi:hypothetical protein